MHFVSGAPISCKSDRVTRSKALRSKRSGLRRHMAAQRAGRTVWPVLPTLAPAARTAGRVRPAAPTARQNVQPGRERHAASGHAPPALCGLNRRLCSPPSAGCEQCRPKAAESVCFAPQTWQTLPSPIGRGVGGEGTEEAVCVLTASAGLQSEACNQRTHSHRRPTSSTITLDHCSLQRMAPCA